MLTIIYLLLTYILHLLDKYSNILRNARCLHQDYNLFNSKITRKKKEFTSAHIKIILLAFTFPEVECPAQVEFFASRN
jgi:hypothetical protein